jgi:hypothetical protein
MGKLSALDSEGFADVVELMGEALRGVEGLINCESWSFRESR